MSEQTICISTETFKFEIDMALNHARAALTTENAKYCQMGLVALAKALALSELVADHREQLVGRDVHLFAEYKDSCVKLINAFWKDFGLVLLQRARTDEQKEAGVPAETFVRHVEPVERPAKPVMARPRPQDKTWQQASNEAHEPANGNGNGRSKPRRQPGRAGVDPVIKRHILENLTPPEGIYKTAWFKQLGEEYGVDAETIRRWDMAIKAGNPPVS